MPWRSCWVQLGGLALLGSSPAKGTQCLIARQHLRSSRGRSEVLSSGQRIAHCALQFERPSNMSLLPYARCVCALWAGMPLPTAHLWHYVQHREAHTIVISP